MYALSEYITSLAVALVVGASLFVASALVLFAREMLARFPVAAWLDATTPSRRAQPAHGVGIEIPK